MTQYEHGVLNPHDGSIEINDRDVRALTEYLTVLPETGRARDADGLFTVVSESGSEYLVDAGTGACECADARYRDPDGGCKHRRRVQYATGDRPIPAWVDADADAVDAQLGIHVESVPRVAATDGGMVATPDGDETDDGEECEDCAVLADGDLPCFNASATATDRKHLPKTPRRGASNDGHRP